MRLALFLAVVSLLAALCGDCHTAEPKKENRPHWLPPGAQIVFSSQWEDGFVSDAAFKLKAKATPQEFDAAIKKLGLTPHTKGRKYTDETIWLQWAGDADSRWDPSPGLNITFVHQEKRWWQLAKYEHGFLYYLSVSH